MAIVFLQADGVPITAQAERQGSAALYGGGSGRQLGGRSGFRVGTPSDTLTATATTWTLKPCSAMIDPGASTHQGMYGWASDSNITGSVTASDATYARKDIVYIQVNDSTAGDGSGATSAPVLYLAGTPSATPTAPTLPARSFLVGTIDVPRTGAGSPAVTLNPARFVASGGFLPVASQAERDALTMYPGLVVWRQDINAQETCNGALWSTLYLGDTGWIAPTVFGNNFTPFTGAGYDGVKYRLAGNQLHVSGAAQNGGTWASGAAICALPAGYRPARKLVGSNCVVDVNGNILTTAAGGVVGSTSATTFAATFPLG